ncbi:MAG: NADPH-dependent F420 reductase [Candidatus Methanomethylicia archaeon]
MINMINDRVIAIIGGTGDQGFGLALRWIKAGENIIIGSRVKEKAEAAVERLETILGAQCNAEGLENREAVSKADIVVLTVPFNGLFDILKSIKEFLRQESILIDVTVPLASTIGGKPTQTIIPWHGSVSKMIAEMLPNVKVVSAFKEISAEALQDIQSPIESDTIVCSDDDDAKRVVIKLAEKIPNIRGIDGGGLENSRISEYLTAFLIGVNIRYGVKKAGIRITQLK